MIVVTAYQYKNSTGEIKLANYASHGKNNVDIAAYGYVETAKRGGQKALAAGTSLAAPAVARTAATIKGLYPILTASEIKDCILSTVESVDNLANKVATGGILDHDAALACAQTKAEMVINTACATSNLTLSSEFTGACNAAAGNIQLFYTGNVPAPTFLWSTGDTTQHLSNLATGIYTVTVTDTARCEQTLSITIPNDCNNVSCQSDLLFNDLSMNSNTYQSNNTIVANGTIEVDSNVVFKAGQSITLTTGFHAKAGGQFLALIEDCSNNIRASYPINQLKTKSSVTKTNKISAKIYPNPTQDILNIEVQKSDMGFDLELYDVMGRRLNTWQVSNNQTTIAVHQLSAGIYFLRIDPEMVKKFVVGRK